MIITGSILFVFEKVLNLQILEKEFRILIEKFTTSNKILYRLSDPLSACILLE